MMISWLTRSMNGKPDFIGSRTMIKKYRRTWHTCARKINSRPEDRWGLQNDLFARVKSSEIPLDDYLKWLSFYDREDAYLPLASMAENLYSAYLVMDSDSRQKITSLAIPKYEDVLAAYRIRTAARRSSSDLPAAGSNHLGCSLIWFAVDPWILSTINLPH